MAACNEAKFVPLTPYYEISTKLERDERFRSVFFARTNVRAKLAGQVSTALLAAGLRRLTVWWAAGLRRRRSGGRPVFAGDGLVGGPSSPATV